MSRWKPDAEGRLITAAITLFDRQGYDQTTVEDIAGAAGLTKRTFFRYFADKREVLFDATHELDRRWTAGIEAMPVDVGPMAALAAGFDEVAELFLDRLPFAKVRSRIIAAHPDLQERELIKLQGLGDTLCAALVDRQVPESAANLAAHTAVTVFHLAFRRWLDQDDSAALGPLFQESLAELRTVTEG